MKHAHTHTLHTNDTVGNIVLISENDLPHI
jgi:hypothetical protein